MVIKAEFKGTSLVPKDIVFPQIAPLSGDFGKEVLAEYKRRVQKDYGNASALNVLNYSGSVVNGSNPFAVVLVNQIVRENEMRTATPADLERALQAGVNLNGTYEDSALVLRSQSDPNAYLAKNIAEQMNQMARKKIKGTVVIPLNGLDLAQDANSPYGLAFKLREDAQIIPTGVLNREGNFTSEDIDLEIGLPKKVGASGDRHSYVINSGLSRLFLSWGLSLRSDDESLVNSYSDGRVFVVSGGATSPQILNKYLASLQAKKDVQIAQIETRFAKAQRVLKGK